MFYRTFVYALCLLFLGVAVSSADARIRKRPDLLLVEWDELIDEPMSVSNPLYEENTNSGENPLYEPKTIVFNPGDFFSGQPVRFELAMDVLLDDGIAEPFNAYEFDIKLFDIATNEPITDFPNGISIGFVIPGLTADDIANAALGYLDESVDPPVWRIEDETCTTGISPAGEPMVVCKTTHLTTFALGPANSVPEPASVMVFAVIAGCVLSRRKN